MLQKRRVLIAIAMVRQGVDENSEDAVHAWGIIYADSGCTETVLKVGCAS